MFELHRHDEFSLFDGYGKAKQAAEYAKELGYSALGIANHGNVNGLVEHYFACQEIGVKPILGVEVYFQPVFNSDKRKYHLCLFAKSLVGYQNLMKLTTESNDNYFYRTATVTFDLLEKYSEGVICSSACVGGFIPQLILEDKKDLTIKALNRFKEIFNEDFYFEIMPYKIDELGTQEKINRIIMKLGQKYDVPCILTTDSHYIKKEDYDSYLVMHDIAKHDVGTTYLDRYMHSDAEVEEAFIKMHGYSTAELMLNLEELADKCEADYLNFPVEIPSFDWDMPPEKVLLQKVKTGLVKKKCNDKEHIERVKYELDVINELGFADYFLLVEDYIMWAKENNIEVGPGRGSVCGSLVAHALDITNVDPLVFGTDFERFLRKDKKKLPDIDIDFETERRQEVIDYLIEKYPGRAAQICSYGLYRIDNLINDLAKVFDVTQEDIVLLKKLLKNQLKDEDGGSEEIADYKELIKDNVLRSLDKQYGKIVKHFAGLYGQVRYIGKHAAGVAITATDISNYVGLQKYSGMMKTAYDLNNLDKLNVLKIDALGLSTMSVIREMEELTGVYFSYEKLYDKEVYKRFAAGETVGIFQFEKDTAQRILMGVEASNIQDIAATTALNRPAPLKLGVAEKFVQAKRGELDLSSSIWYKYTEETYGALVYQEQVMRVCRGLARMEWQDIDKVMKGLRTGSDDTLKKKFVEGATKYSKMAKDEAEQLFHDMTLYLFNKGHAAGYAIISYWCMWFKHHHSLEFWYATMKYEIDEMKLNRYKAHAVKDGCVILLPHVNGTSRFSIKTLEGDRVIQEGLSAIKNVGINAAKTIEDERLKNGRFTSYDDFVSRVPKRSVNSRVVDALDEAGALEFKKKVYFNRVIKYNSALYTRAN